MLLHSFDVAGDFVGQKRHDGQGQGKGWDKVNNITTWSNSHQGKNKKGKRFWNIFQQTSGDHGAVISWNEGNFCSMYQTSF